MAYYYKTNNKWSFRIDIGSDPVTGKRRQKSKSGFLTKKAAQIAAAALKNDLAINAYIPENTITFEQFSAEWLQLYSQNVKISTVRVRKHEIGLLLPHLAKCRLQDITRQQYQLVLSKLKKQNLADNTISGAHGTAKMIFRKAREFNLIQIDPTEFAKPPRKQITLDDINNDAVKYMEKEELSAFLKTTKAKGLYGDYATFILLAYSGMRVGELCALTWNDIDIEQKIITITKTTYNPDNRPKEYMLLTPKTAKSIRTIEVADIVIKALLEYKAQQNIEKMRLKNIWHNKYDFVFTAARSPGYPILQKNIQSRLSRLLKLCGMQNHFTPHSFRHTHTSLLAEAGVELHDIMDRLGHADDNTTRNVYLHVTKTQKKYVSQKFAKLLQDVSI